MQKIGLWLFRVFAASIALVILISPLITRVAFGQTPEEAPKPRDLTEMEKDKISTLLSKYLINPNSALYIWPKLMFTKPDKNGALPYCGEINVKNELGKYIGFRPFSISMRNVGNSLSPLPQTVGMEDTIAPDGISASICSIDGYSLPKMPSWEMARGAAWAEKCFSSATENIQERYASNHLRNVETCISILRDALALNESSNINFIIGVGYKILYLELTKTADFAVGKKEVGEIGLLNRKQLGSFYDYSKYLMEKNGFTEDDVCQWLTITKCGLFLKTANRLAADK